MELCNSIFELLSSDNLKIKKEDVDEIKHYIDDNLVWLYVKEKISKIEQEQAKIAEAAIEFAERENSKVIDGFSGKKENFNTKSLYISSIPFIFIS